MNEYLRTIIVEDEKHTADLLVYLLEKYCPMIIVEGVARNIPEARKLFYEVNM